MNKQSLFNELARNIDWNPADKSNDPHVDIKTGACFTAATKHFRSDSTMKDTLMRLAAKDSKAPSDLKLAWIVKRLALGDLMLYAAGKLSFEKIAELVGEGIQDTGLYAYSVDEVAVFVERCREVCTEIHKLRESGALDFDMSKVELKTPGTGETTAINRLLSVTTLPPLQVLIDMAGDATDKIKSAQELRIAAEESAKELTADVERLQSEVGKLSMNVGRGMEKAEFESDGTIPEGTMEYVPASTIFKGVELDVDFDVPFFTWDGVHPDVPSIDDHYIFRSHELSDCLYALVSNQRQYLHGHTGCGKTTLIEQMAARLNYPYARINFDSEITRMDLIGRDTMTKVDNPDGSVSSVSVFVDGMLPRAMSSPYILMLDEIDFVRPDVAYVMQAATEGNGLRITEDGDRFVKPHENFRMFASANTVGQGDEYGLYQGARPQSQALLDRFTVWTHVEYLDPKKRDELVKAKVPGIKTNDAKTLSRYADEHQAAFVESTILQPLSPRGLMAIAQATVVFGDIRRALATCVLNKANKEDRSTLRGIIDRVCK